MKGEMRKREEKENAKAEEEYIKNREHMFQERSARQQREQAMTDPINCYCEFRVASAKEQEGKFQFKIHVTFSGQEWIVHRFEKQFLDLYTNLISCNVNGIRGSLPRKGKDNGMDWVCANLSTFLSGISRERAAIFADKKATAYYTRFIAPCQLGDEKGPELAMPFKMEAL